MHTLTQKHFLLITTIIKIEAEALLIWVASLVVTTMHQNRADAAIFSLILKAKKIRRLPLIKIRAVNTVNLNQNSKDSKGFLGNNNLKFQVVSHSIIWLQKSYTINIYTTGQHRHPFIKLNN